MKLGCCKMRLSLEEARLMQAELIELYKGATVQNRMKQFNESAKAVSEETLAREKEAFLMEIQTPLVAKYGFEQSAKGVQDCMMAFSVDEINLDPDVFKKNNMMEVLLCAGAQIDAYMPGWQQNNLHLLGGYRELPKLNFPIIECTEQKRVEEGCLETVPKEGLLPPVAAEELIAACRSGDVARASHVLGVRKTGASAKRVFVQLGFKSMGAAGAKTFAKALSKDLEELEVDISGNNIGAEGAKALAAAVPKGLKVLKLNLAGNRLTAAGVAAIAASIPKDLDVLSLGFAGMRMGPAGAKDIAKSLPPNMKELSLDFYGNGIQDEGMLAISRALPKSLTYLNLVLLENQLSRVGFNAVDRQIDNPEHEHHLPNLRKDEYKKTARLELKEFAGMPDGSMIRQCDWRTDI